MYMRQENAQMNEQIFEKNDLSHQLQRPLNSRKADVTNNKKIHYKPREFFSYCVVLETETQLVSGQKKQAQHNWTQAVELDASKVNARIHSHPFCSIP